MNTQKIQNRIQHRNLFRRLDTGKLELSIMCLPAMIVLFLLSYLPMSGLIVAFQDYRVDKGFFSEFIGFDNFDYLFESQDAWRIIRNTIGYNLMFIFIGTAFAILLALMLNELTKRVFIKVYQTLMIFPTFLSWVVVGYASYAFLNMDYGIINSFLKLFSIDPVLWYLDAKYWPFIFIVVNIWKGAGYSCIIFYAGLMGIDPAYYEAAAIDGASKLQRIRYISIPSLMPLISIVILLALGRIFYADFGMFYNLPQQVGTLYEATEVIDTYVYRSLRVTGKVGMASAAGFLQSMVGFVLVFATNFVVKKVNPENAIY